MWFINFSEPLRAAFKCKGSVYNCISQEQEVWTAKVRLGELSKQPVIWGKPGLGVFKPVFPSDLCIQVWTWKDGGLGSDFIWICKGIFIKGAFVKRPACSGASLQFRNAEKVWMEPLLANLFFLLPFKIMRNFWIRHLPGPLMQPCGSLPGSCPFHQRVLSGQ